MNFALHFCCCSGLTFLRHLSNTYPVGFFSLSRTALWGLLLLKPMNYWLFQRRSWSILDAGTVFIDRLTISQFLTWVSDLSLRNPLPLIPSIWMTFLLFFCPSVFVDNISRRLLEQVSNVESEPKSYRDRGYGWHHLRLVLFGIVINKIGPESWKQRGKINREETCANFILIHSLLQVFLLKRLSETK